ncbi:MAG: single-stranded DNA-binding protein [Theionarchaea archaeon]|nr:single-stranded DNA-binding protein [Theionarchaea archaeon]
MYVEEIMSVAELTRSSRKVNIKVHVVRKNPTNQVVSRKDGSTYDIAEALVGDPSGCILMTLWNEDIKLVEEGKNYHIFNGYVSVFKNSMRLNLGRNGTLEKIDEDIAANEKVNVSEKTVESTFKPRRSYNTRSNRY